MRRAQATLEYVYLIGIVAAAIIVMLAYISRGFQGNLRALTEQVGAGAYAPGNTTINNTETRHTGSTVVSKSTTTTTYGNGQAENVAMHENSEQQKPLRAELDVLREDMKTATGAALESINSQISAKTTELNDLVAAYKVLSDAWDARTINPDITNATSSNIETSTQTVTKNTNEAQGNLSNDSWH